MSTAWLFSEGGTYFMPPITTPVADLLATSQFTLNSTEVIAYRSSDNISVIKFIPDLTGLSLIEGYLDLEKNGISGMSLYSYESRLTSYTGGITLVGNEARIKFGNLTGYGDYGITIVAHLDSGDNVVLAGPTLPSRLTVKLVAGVSFTQDRFEQCENTDITSTAPSSFVEASYRMYTSSGTVLSYDLGRGITAEGNSLVVSIKAADLDITGMMRHELMTVDETGNVTTIFDRSLTISPSNTNTVSIVT